MKEVQIGPDLHHKTKIGGSLDAETKEQLIQVLTKNRDGFAWSLEDMLRIDPNFIYHKLFITPQMRKTKREEHQRRKQPSCCRRGSCERYNQIKMHSSNESKTMFITDEVYIDNMVVKSNAKDQHVEALTFIFLVLRDHQLKFNPDKCFFRIKAGKFLDFMLTKRGIKANPEKCETMIRMRSLKNVKEMQ
ncbi:Retrovirus-related Pol polyprotein from transposon 17.6, partial [Mucuna pruriens]